MGRIRLPPSSRLGDGAHYTYKTTSASTEWLCGVTEFVFGEMPERIWFKVS